MLDIADELTRWSAQGRPYAVATVVAVGGSAPRQPGAALAVDAGGTAVGSVSGGCVEGAVYELCQEVLETGEPLLRSFGYADDDAFAVGLTCGGVIDVFVQRVAPGTQARPELAGALAAASRGEAAALARVVAGPAGLPGRALLVRPGGAYEGTLGDPELDRTAAAEAHALLNAGRTGVVGLGVGAGAGAGAGAGLGGIGAEGGRCGEPLRLLVEASIPPPRLLVFGAIDFAAALVRVGTFLGYRVSVCDARPVFATAGRFPEADEVVVEWPHRYLERTPVDGRTVVCVLTHDAKFDVPLLERALRMPVAYVGAMGSRRTHADRLGRLRDAGLGEAELGRLRSPIGLDLGARTPEETALSIAAEFVAHRGGGTGRPLTDVTTPIHPVGLCGV
ncbi:XdhC/CoxI family protein [Streptomyces sp. NPDC005722]